MKLLIGIPAYNEEKAVALVISKIPKKVSGIDKIDVLVVNDGSRDKTARSAEKKRVKVVSHMINRGLGAALQTIIYYAKTMDYDVLVTLDADGQHDPIDIKGLVRPIMSKKADVVVGSRWKKKVKKPFSRYLVNQLANIFTFLLFGVWTSDSQSGFRALNRKAIEKIKLKSDGMEVSSEFFREIFKNNLSFHEISIKPVYTKYSMGKGQKITNAPNVFIRLFLKLLS